MSSSLAANDINGLRGHTSVNTVIARTAAITNQAGSSVGLFVPVPFWIVHRYFPKLRADYLYTPVIWWVSFTCYRLELLKVLSAITSVGCALVSTLRFCHTFRSPIFRSGGWELGMLYFCLNDRIFHIFWIFKRYPRWFAKYNYIIAAGMKSCSLQFPSSWLTDI